MTSNARDAAETLAVVGFFSSLAVLILVAAYRLMGTDDPAPVDDNVRIVRMLDVTIKDSNTTNRRQRFICEPAKEGK